jgi:hypothetical protein
VLVALRQRLWSGPRRSLRDAVAFQGRAFLRATVLVRVFYGIGAVWLVSSMARWPGVLEAEHIQARGPVGPLLELVGTSVGVPVVLGGYLVATLVAMLCPERRPARAAYALALLLAMGVTNGFGKIGHDMHAWFYMSAALALLPNGPWDDVRSVGRRHVFLTIVWAGQLFVLFTYTLTGLWKVHAAVDALFTPATSGFEPDGFSYILADRILKTDQQTVLGDFVLQHPWTGWALYVGTMYLESASILIAFRPRLHRAWGLGLIGFHIGTRLAMGFAFTAPVALLALFLVQSPAAPERVTLGEAVRDLPGVHVLVRRRRRGGAVVAAPDPVADPVA